MGRITRSACVTLRRAPKGVSTRGSQPLRMNEGRTEAVLSFPPFCTSKETLYRYLPIGSISMNGGGKYLCRMYARRPPTGPFNACLGEFLELSRRIREGCLVSPCRSSKNRCFLQNRSGSFLRRVHGVGGRGVRGPRGAALTSIRSGR